MNMNTENPASITEANQNFPKDARLADIDFSSAQEEQYADDEEVFGISRRLIAINRQAYETLAK